MALLRRMVLISGEPFTGLDPAAALLERTQHPAEASEFLTTLIKAEPWNQDAKRRLAQAQGGAPKTPNPWDSLPTDPAAREKALLAIIAADPRPAPSGVGSLVSARRDTRNMRLALDYEKAELLLKERGIAHTIVVFGSTRICEPAEARRNVDVLTNKLEATPAQDAMPCRRRFVRWQHRSPSR